TPSSIVKLYNGYFSKLEVVSEHSSIKVVIGFNSQSNILELNLKLGTLKKFSHQRLLMINICFCKS
ncbi:MAG: hypothetical protein IKB98_01255, partial [Clostridia bacterium]|nr:hypothetical protein [Clostridia bacterium]